MAVGVTRDHHNLRRNLKLNGNYISNDGGDEGIKIQDNGDIDLLGVTTLGTGSGGGDYQSLLLSSYSDKIILGMSFSNVSVPTIAAGGATWTFGDGAGFTSDAAAASPSDASGAAITLQAGDLLGSKIAIGSRATGYSPQINGYIDFVKHPTQDEVGARIWSQTEGSVGDGDWPSKLVFATTPDGSVTPLDRITIASTGLVGINADDPGSLLDIRGAAGTGAASAGVLTLSTAETTVRVGTVDQLGRIDFQAPKEGGGTDAILVGASIHAECEEDFSSSNNSTALVFSTGTTSAPIERMRIDQDGIVGINGGKIDFNATAQPGIKLKSSEDDADYLHIATSTNGASMISTVDDSGNNAAALTFNVQGYLYFSGTYLVFAADTKTASGTGDSSFQASETLNLSSGAGGSDVHYGIRYSQTQTNLGGWDSVYLMYLTGGDAARTFAIQADGKVGIGVTDPASPLEIFNTASQLKISYDESNYADISVADDGHLEIATTGTDADLTLDASNDIIMDVGSISAGHVFFKAAGTERASLTCTTTSNSLKLKAGTAAADYFTLTTATNGVTTLVTIDGDGEEADLILDIDGYIDMNSASGEDITLDSGGDIILDSVDGVFKFYKDGDTDDLCSLTVGANGRTTITTADSDGAVGHLDFAVDGHIDFNTSGCGFTQLTVTFGESGVIGGAGNDTDVDFRLGNKAWLELTGNLGALNNINLIFPAVSGNFVLVLEQDGTGSRTIHADAWEGNMYTSDGSTPATTANPLWAGGSAPTLTTTADYFDIISFYWDATNGRVFAVPTLNFS